MTTTDHAAALAAAIRDADIHRFCCTDAQRSALAAYEASIAPPPDPYALLRIASREDLIIDEERLQVMISNTRWGPETGHTLGRLAQLLLAILAAAPDTRAGGFRSAILSADHPLLGIVQLADKVSR